MAERHKPSGKASKRLIFKNHLEPALGRKRLDQISDEDVARLKASLHDRKAPTVNNVLSTLSVSSSTQPS